MCASLTSKTSGESVAVQAIWASDSGLATGSGLTGFGGIGLLPYSRGLMMFVTFLGGLQGGFSSCHLEVVVERGLDQALDTTPCAIAEENGQHLAPQRTFVLLFSASVQLWTLTLPTIASRPRACNEKRRKRKKWAPCPSMLV